MLNRLTIKTKLVLVLAFLSVQLVAGATLGIISLGQTNDAMSSMYEDRLVPLTQLDRIIRLLNINMLSLSVALTAEPEEQARLMDTVEANIAAISQHWAEYMDTRMAQEEQTLAAGFSGVRGRLLEEGFRPAIGAIRAGNLEAARALFNGPVQARFPATRAAVASTSAASGGGAMGEVVATMAAIDASARKVEDIIAVIDGIAFQTNLLALNAAVEAARAGEQGRGFAVVAGEVRGLAQRSTQAAAEIKRLIGDAIANVNAGSRQVGAAGATMQDIVQRVQHVTHIMGEISAASREQSAGLEQISQAVAQMEAVTQQDAALVEQAAAASRALQEQSAALAGLVGVFRLHDAPSGGPGAIRGRQGGAPRLEAGATPMRPAAA